MCDKIYKNRQLSTMNRGSRFSDKCNSPVAKKISAHWSALAGTRGCMRTGYVSGRERKMRRGRVARPKGTRGTLLTDWRPDRLHSPHSSRSWNRFLFNPLCSAFLCSWLPGLCSLNQHHRSATLYQPTPSQLFLPPPLHPASRPSSSAMLSDSTFPDVRWLLHHWDYKAFCCCHLAFEKLYMGEWDTITHCVGVMYRVLLRTKQWRTIIRVHILCASCQTVDRM